MRGSSWSGLRAGCRRDRWHRACRGIKQKNSTRNPRSTVATATEIFDYLRLLFARVGRTYCLLCGQEVKKDTVDEVVERLLALARDAVECVLSD